MASPSAAAVNAAVAASSSGAAVGAAVLPLLLLILFFRDLFDLIPFRFFDFLLEVPVHQLSCSSSHVSLSITVEGALLRRGDFVFGISNFAMTHL